MLVPFIFTINGFLDIAMTVTFAGDTIVIAKKCRLGSLVLFSLLLSFRILNCDLNSNMPFYNIVDFEKWRG